MLPSSESVEGIIRSQLGLLLNATLETLQGRWTILKEVTVQKCQGLVEAPTYVHENPDPTGDFVMFR